MQCIKMIKQTNRGTCLEIHNETVFQHFLINLSLDMHAINKNFTIQFIK